MCVGLPIELPIGLPIELPTAIELPIAPVAYWIALPMYSNFVFSENTRSESPAEKGARALGRSWDLVHLVWVRKHKPVPIGGNSSNKQ